MTVAGETAVKIQPRRLAHANLFVGDMERSTEFYNKVCGFELVRREPGIFANFLSGGTTHHDIACMQAMPQVRVGLGGHVQIPQGRGQVPGLNHFGWEMENEADLVAAYKRARAANLEIHRTTDHQVSHSVYLFDPDGNLNEFYVDVMKDWRSVFNLSDESLISSEWDPAAKTPSTERMYDERPNADTVPGAIFDPVSIAHAIVATKNFEKMRDFYVGVAGLAPVEEVPGRQVLLKGATGKLALVLVNRAELKSGPHTLAFRLKDDVDLAACRKALEAAGVKIIKQIDTPAKQAIAIADPDGLVLEFHKRAGAPARLSDVEVAPYFQ
jgi:catechol 2,3-dioxygenase